VASLEGDFIRGVASLEGDFIRGVASLEGDNSAVFYYFSASEEGLSFVGVAL